MDDINDLMQAYLKGVTPRKVIAVFPPPEEELPVVYEDNHDDEALATVFLGDNS